MILAPCAVLILAAGMAILLFWNARTFIRLPVALVFALAAVLLGDIGFTGKAEVKMVACGTAAVAAEYVPRYCPF